MLTKDDDFDRSLVTRQNRGLDRNIMGSRHSNTLLDTRVYEVQFQDASISEYAAKLIDEKLYPQKYPDGNEFLILKDILDQISTDKAVNP